MGQGGDEAVNGRLGRKLRGFGFGFGAALAFGLLTGCAQAPKPMYHWGGYQAQVYEYLKGDGAGTQAQAGELETQQVNARAAGAALPPGFRAHLGMLYLQLGRADEARQQWEAEKSSFPESAAYMDFLLKRLDAPKS